VVVEKKAEVYTIDMSKDEAKIQAFFKGIATRWFNEDVKTTRYKIKHMCLVKQTIFLIF
jgi:hypothetical protein